jgi:hypothetical protein
MPERFPGRFARDGGGATVPANSHLGWFPVGPRIPPRPPEGDPAHPHDLRSTP